MTENPEVHVNDTEFKAQVAEVTETLLTNIVRFSRLVYPPL